MSRLMVSAGLVVLLCAVAVLSFAGATDERGREEQLSAKPETLEIGFEDKLTSKTVKLSKGGSLDVKLDSNPTTGYKWQLSGIDGGSVKETGGCLDTLKFSWRPLAEREWDL
jgi:hypothetical protein